MAIGNIILGGECPAPVSFNPPTSYANTVSLIADLRAIASPNATVSYYVNGNLALNDGGQGRYTWQAAITNADDDYNFIRPDHIPDGSAGRFVRMEI